MDPAARPAILLDGARHAGASLATVMDGHSRQDAGLALRVLVRLGVHEGVPAYIAVLAVIVVLFLLSALR